MSFNVDDHIKKSKRKAVVGLLVAFILAVILFLKIATH